MEVRPRQTAQRLLSSKGNVYSLGRVDSLEMERNKCILRDVNGDGRGLGAGEGCTGEKY